MRNSGHRGQVLILLAAWLFFGGSAASALVVYDRPASAIRKAIKRTVTDAGRKDQILADIGLWESIQEIRDETILSDREEILGALRRRDAKITDLDPVTERLDRTFGVMDREFLDLRFRVKEHVTSQEWATIVARP